MNTPQVDRRMPEMPSDGIVRPHDTSTSVKAALEMQKAGRSREAYELLAGAGFGDGDAARILAQRDVRATDASDHEE